MTIYYCTRLFIISTNSQRCGDNIRDILSHRLSILNPLNLVLYPLIQIFSIEYFEIQVQEEVPQDPPGDPKENGEAEPEQVAPVEL